LIGALSALSLAVGRGEPADSDGPPDWSLTAEQHVRLANGEILVLADVNASQTEGDILAAIQIAAPAERIFRTMTDCREALEFVPHLEVCRVLESAPDGSWQIVEHAADFGWYVPRTDYVFRADYEPYRRIRFEQVRGDLRENRGVWEMRPLSEGDPGTTILTYRVRVVPRFFVPRWMVRSSLRRDLPLRLGALRERCEGP
jgi:uncharacterized protein YndB with AHSA1/START domain